MAEERHLKLDGTPFDVEVVAAPVFCKRALEAEGYRVSAAGPRDAVEVDFGRPCGGARVRSLQRTVLADGDEVGDVDQHVEGSHDRGHHPADENDAADVAYEVVVLLRGAGGEKALAAGAAGSGRLGLGAVAGTSEVIVGDALASDDLRLKLCRSGFLVSGEAAAGPASGLRLGSGGLPLARTV